MCYTKDIFDILSRGAFISQYSVSQQLSNLYDAIEDDFQQYQDYFSGIGFLLEGGNGYYYFSAPGRDDEGQFTRLYLYRATDNPSDPFIKVE